MTRAPTPTPSVPCKHERTEHAPGIGDYCLDCDAADGLDGEPPEVSYVPPALAAYAARGFKQKVAERDAWIARAVSLLGQTLPDDKATDEHREERRALLAEVPR